MTLDQWTAWLTLVVGFVFGLVVNGIRLADHRRALALHLDATSDVLVLMQKHGQNTVPIRGVLDSLDNIRRETL